MSGSTAPNAAPAFSNALPSGASRAETPNISTIAMRHSMPQPRRARKPPPFIGFAPAAAHRTTMSTVSPKATAAVSRL